MGEHALISLGSNIEPERHLPLAADGMHALGRVLAVSQAYRNPAIGPEGQPPFLNAGVLLDTALAPRLLQRELRRIESRLGRRRTADKFAPRVIDLDLVLYGTLVLEEGSLRLPDPDLLERPYLAVLMAELAPDARHPITGERMAALAARLAPSAKLEVEAEVSALLRSRAIGPEAGAPLT